MNCVTVILLFLQTVHMSLPSSKSWFLLRRLLFPKLLQCSYSASNTSIFLLCSSSMLLFFNLRISISASCCWCCISKHIACADETAGFVIGNCIRGDLIASVSLKCLDVLGIGEMSTWSVLWFSARRSQQLQLKTFFATLQPPDHTPPPPPPHTLAYRSIVGLYPANTKHLNNICTTSSMLVQHCTNVIQMFCVCWIVGSRSPVTFQSKLSKLIQKVTSSLIVIIRGIGETGAPWTSGHHEHLSFWPSALSNFNERTL